MIVNGSFDYHAPFDQGLSPKYSCCSKNVIQGSPMITFQFIICFLFSRATEKEKMIVEEETQKRVEELVAKRVEEQLAKRKDEIDAEVMKRVEEAKRVMEKQMVEEFEKRRLEQLEEQQMKEVKCMGSFLQ